MEKGLIHVAGVICPIARGRVNLCAYENRASFTSRRIASVIAPGIFKLQLFAWMMPAILANPTGDNDMEPNRFRDSLGLRTRCA